MKKIFVILLMMVCPTISEAQTTIKEFLQMYTPERVTFPVEGSIFQQNSSGRHNLKV
jgi:hypothetical protein